MMVRLFLKKGLKLILKIGNLKETVKWGLVPKSCKYDWFILLFEVDVNPHVLGKKEISYRASNEIVRDFSFNY